MNQGADGGCWLVRGWQGGGGGGWRRGWGGLAEGCSQHTEFAEVSSDQSAEEARHFRNFSASDQLCLRRSFEIWKRRETGRDRCACVCVCEGVSGSESNCFLYVAVKNMYIHLRLYFLLERSEKRNSDQHHREQPVMSPTFTKSQTVITASFSTIRM